MLDLDRIIFEPAVTMMAGTYINFESVLEAVDQFDGNAAAETYGTPLNNLIARVGETGDPHGGNGDDLAEFAGRQCYRSWTHGRDNADYIRNVIGMGHGSIFEHASVVFQITGVSRSLTHELIRHRVGTAYSQESQRYVDAKDMKFVVPPLLAQQLVGLDEVQIDAHSVLGLFRRSCNRALKDYSEFQGDLIAMAKRAEATAFGDDEKAATSAKKRANEAARALLPNASETRLVFTTNLRALRHILTLRGTEHADLEIRRLVIKLLDASRHYAPNFFEDVLLMLGADELEALKTGTGRV